MNKAPDFMSKLAEDFRKYVAFMVGSGRVFRVETSILKAFDRFIVRNGILAITETVVNSYVYSVPSLTAQQYAKGHRVVQKFAEYMHLRERGENVRPLPPVKNTKRHVAYVYSKEDISRLLCAAGQLPPLTSLRPHTYFVLFGLLYSSGLRISEAISLERSDINFAASTILIRNTKFRKSRIVPIHASTLAQLLKYAKLRDALYPTCDDNAFFVNNKKKRLVYSTVNNIFLQLSQQLGLRSPDGQMPRIHDLRHTFAIRRVAAWYDEGADIHAKLPLLATYMGHAHFEDTTYYLMAGAELMARGASRFQREGVLNG